MIPADSTRDQTLQLKTQQKRDAMATEQCNRQLVSRKTGKLSTQSDGALERADGYAEGRRYFQRGLTPPTLLKISPDEYARGFRAGYYLHVELLNQAGLAGFAKQAG